MNNYEIAIVKEKFSKKTRTLSQIFLPLLLLFLGFLLIEFSFILFVVISVFLWIIFQKVFEKFSIIGKVIIHPNEFIISANNSKIPIESIKKITLKPNIGYSRFIETFKTYKIKIEFYNGEFEELEVSRGLIYGEKVIFWNILNQKRFDLIKYLKNSKINFSISYK